MKNKSVPFSAEEIQDALSDPKYLEDLREIESEYCKRAKVIACCIGGGVLVVSGLVFLKMIWG
jgi:hypothetical protein